MSQNYAYFAHRTCEYYPCHPGADPENFNCLFCYCPFYMLGTRCGGNFRVLDNGYKDCSDCLYPHLRENYQEIVGRYHEIVEAMALQAVQDPGQNRERQGNGAGSAVSA